MGLAFHFLADGYAPMSDEANIWVLYMLAPLGVAFSIIFLWNLACAPYREQRDEVEKLKRQLNLIGPILPEVVAGSEWAKGLSIMSIQDLACALSNINPDSFPSSPRAKAVGRELVGAAKVGWICTNKEHCDAPIRSSVTVIKGKPSFDGIKRANLKTQIFTPSLRRGFLDNRPDYKVNWLTARYETKERIFTMEIR
jgi:hypothetical protein